jgi:hypothetical protein
MGYQDVLEALSGTGVAATPGVNAAARSATETETWLVASATGGATTILDGDVMCIDFATYTTVRSRIAKKCAATTDVPLGVAFLNATVTIPQTTAAGDIVQPILIMRRGFHHAVSATTGGAAGQALVTSATSGQGAPVAVASLTAAQSQTVIGIAMGAIAANKVPLLVQPQA